MALLIRLWLKSQHCTVALAAKADYLSFITGTHMGTTKWSSDLHTEQRMAFRLLPTQPATQSQISKNTIKIDLQDIKPMPK